MAMNGSTSRQCTGAANEEWVLVRSLGSGSYGDVHLYQNEKTLDTIAVKRFKGKIQHQKSCDRWVKEVKILQTLDHENIVKAFDVPKQLIDPSNHHPLLATEYCEGGNLRRVIGKISHLSGLPQNQVCNILSQIADGLMYLHRKGIIHRDLKPENIVLKPAGERIIYKIIDLGFAKDLGNETASSSFAGTHVYADPYLHMKRHYDKPVDYWSLGVLCFELVTGRRPFVPVEHHPPVPLYNCMDERPSDCVCMVQTIDGKHEFSRTIPRANSLSRNMALLFEIWLRNMFLCDRNKRGHIVQDDGKCISWYDYLKKVTSIKELKVFNMKTSKMHTFRSDEITTIGILQENLAKVEEANIPVKNQLLLLPDGQVAPPTRASSRIRTMGSGSSDDIPDYFLFDKSVRPSSTNSSDHCSMLPPLAKAIAQNPSAMVEGKKILRCIWAECLFVCKTQAMEVKWVQEGSTVLRKYFEKEIKEVVSNASRMAEVHDKLEGMREMFQKSVTEDLKSYEAQASCGIHSDEMVSKWIETKDVFHDIPKYLKQRLRNIVSSKETLDGGYNLFQVSCTQMLHYNQLQRCKEKSMKLFAEVAEEWKSQKNDDPVKCFNWLHIVTCMEQCIKLRQTLRREISEKMNSVLKILRRIDLAALNTEIGHVTVALEKHKENLLKAQLERQTNLWRSLRYLLEQCNALERQNIERRLPSIATPPAELSTMMSPGGNVALSRILPARSPESLLTLEESLSTREEFTEAVDRYNAESSSLLRGLQDLDLEFGEPP